MRNGFSKLAVSLFLLTWSAGAGWTQQQVPPRSLDAMQQAMAAVEVRLYAANDRFWHHGEYERCIATLRLITEMDPRDTQAFDTAAWLMENQLRDDESEAFRLKGISLNPNDPDLYFSLGHFYYTHERYQDAVRNIETAVSLGSPSFTWHALAHAYEGAGDIYDALGIWLALESVDGIPSVPSNQIDGILQGEPGSDLPQALTRARETRKARQHSAKE